MREYASIIYEAFVYHFEKAETVEASAFCFTENILPKKAAVSTETAENILSFLQYVTEMAEKVSK